MATEMKTVEHAGRKKQQGTRSILRVAAYCRVSTQMEEQDLSYESQCAYFENLVNENPGMTLVGVYGDHGISGLHMETRPSMQNLLEDCEAGKINLVLTKSISRLSRNASDFKKIMTTFKQCGVRAYFEKEELYSDDPQCEMLMAFMIAVAAEESRSISENIQIANAHNNAMGRPTIPCPYGFRKKERKPGEPHVWEVYEPEARLVREIFKLKEQKLSNSEIARKMLLMQEKEPDAKQRNWSAGSVHSILANEAYKGDLLTSKSYTPDYLVGKRKKNEGERPQYYLEDHHPAIVSKELFDEVQKIKRDYRRHYE